ncbi:hypothetical protein C8Q80DRAFT_1098427 [Daedaleopsis nitida]|nr:hypothetical protein C8Q80DRAFT_1098427 [Daedaleopsis nitida]
MSSLNTDVLSNIMACCDSPSISRMMQTNCDLHHGGAKYLLEDLVTLRNAADIQSFILFMLVGRGVRFAYLWGLSFTCRDISPGLAAELVSFLQTCSSIGKIGTLEILHAEDLLESDEGLVDAFASLKTIKDLKVYEMGHEAAEFLRQLQSAVVKAELDVLQDDDEDWDPDDHYTEDEQDYYKNPIVLLRNSQQSLEMLIGQGFDTVISLLPTYAVSYPHVDFLDLRDVDPPLTVPLAHAFPNLSFLALMVDDDDLESMGNGLQTIVEHRAVNIIEQMQHGSWKSLDRCLGRLIDHFLLAVQCHVKALTIRGNGMEPRMLRDVLGQTKPLHLSFEGFEANLFDSGFRRVMRRPYAAQLRCMELVLVVGAVLEPENVDVPDMIDNMIDAFQSLSLTSFGLVIQCFLLPNPPPRNVNDHPLCAAEKYLQDLNLEALSRRIQDGIPSLRTIFIALRNVRGRPDTRYQQGLERCEFSMITAQFAGSNEDETTP